MGSLYERHVHPNSLFISSYRWINQGPSTVEGSFVYRKKGALWPDIRQRYKIGMW